MQQFKPSKLRIFGYLLGIGLLSAFLTFSIGAIVVGYFPFSNFVGAVIGLTILAGATALTKDYSISISEETLTGPRVFGWGPLTIRVCDIDLAQLRRPSLWTRLGGDRQICTHTGERILLSGAFTAAQIAAMLDLLERRATRTKE